MTVNAARAAGLPGDAIVLHVGPHKTGTTAIQGALAAARPRLREAGVLYPGGVDHNREAAAALNRPQGWDERPVPRAVWLALAAMARKHPGRVAISSETFCEADTAAARRVVADLGAGRVRVVVTLRPLERILPSTWQQSVKAGYQVSYERWLERVLESRDKLAVASTFWLRNHHPQVIRRWTDAVGGADRVTVVVADAARPRALFDAFEDLLELPRDTLDPHAAPRNRSLTLAEAELVRQLNRRVRREVSHEAYYRLVKRGAVLDLVERRTPQRREPALTTPAWAVERAREFSRSDVVEIEAMGVPVVGDLRLLAPDSPIPDGSAAAGPNTVPVGLAASFAADLFTTGLREAAQLRGEAMRQDTATGRPARSVGLGARLDRAAARARDGLVQTHWGARLAARIRAGHRERAAVPPAASI